MKRFTDAGRKSLADDNLYSALSLALTLPDICASLEDPGPGKSRSRYIRWCTQWVEPKYTVNVGTGGGTPQVFLSAENCYNLRNSLIHSGSGEVEPTKRTNMSEVVFVDDTIGAHMNMINDVLQLRASDFSRDLFDAADEWDSAMADNASVQAEKAKLLQIKTRGDRILGGAVQLG